MSTSDTAPPTGGFSHAILCLGASGRGAVGRSLVGLLLAIVGCDGFSGPKDPPRSLDVETEVPGAPPGGFPPDGVPDSVKTLRVVFEGDEGFRCCVAVDPRRAPQDEESLKRFIELDRPPAGAALLRIDGFPTDFAPTLDDITEVCNVQPAAVVKGPCDPQRLWSPSFRSRPKRVVVPSSGRGDAGRIELPSVPFLVDFQPPQDAEVMSPVIFLFTIADALFEIDPASVKLDVRHGGHIVEVPVELKACSDAGAMFCSPNGELSVKGFTAQGSPIPLEGPVVVRMRATNLAPTPESMEFSYSFAVSTPTPTSTSTRTLTATATQSPTHSLTATPSFTPTATGTHTATASPTATSTGTPTMTASHSPTSSPTALPTSTLRSTHTATQTATVTLTGTFTATPTASDTATPSSTATATPAGLCPAGTQMDAPVLTILDNLDPPGRQQLRLRGSFVVRSLQPVIDPVTNGFGFAIYSRFNGTELLRFFVPPGAQVRRGSPGWRVGSLGGRWTYEDEGGQRTPGIRRVTIVQKTTVAASLFSVAVFGSNGDFRVAPPEAPFRVDVVLGGSTQAAAGQCGTANFNVDTSERPRCTAQTFGDWIRCR